MNKCIYLSLGFLLLSLQVTGQAANTLLDKQQFQEYNFNSTNFIRQMPSKPTDVKGSFYLNEAWSKGNLYFMNKKKLENLLLRYDVVNNLLEINLNDGIRAVHGSQLHSFEMLQNEIPQLYVNTKNYTDNPGLKGFYRVLTEGKLTLLSHTFSEMIAPNYNVALNVGEKDAKIVQKEKLYFFTDNAIQEVPNKSKKLIDFFGTKADAISKLIDDKNLNIKATKDVLLIVHYYNNQL